MNNFDREQEQYERLRMMSPEDDEEEYERKRLRKEYLEERGDYLRDAKKDERTESDYSKSV